MVDFVTSAPGKVILFGEHAVVHGKPAIAAAVSLRTYTLVTKLEDASYVELDFVDIDFRKKWKLADLPWAEFGSERKDAAAVGKSIEAGRVDALNASALKDLDNSFQHAAALAFLYLYMSLCTPDMPGHKFVTKSTLPVGAGLGSSACLSVCLSAALLRLGGHITNPVPNTSSEESLGLINAWSFLGECCIHGNPSGIDNAVATRGGAVLFQRPSRMEPIADFPAVELVLTNTGFPRRTAELVAGVGRLKDRLPSVVEPILESIDNVSQQAFELLTNKDRAGSLNADLGSLVHINHALLVALGVSHPALEKIKLAADSIGLGETKLTGAGGGGCAITLVTCDKSEAKEKVEQLRQMLPEGFQVFDTLLGGPGAGMVEVGDIDLDKFNSMDNSEFSKLGSWTHW